MNRKHFLGSVLASAVTIPSFGNSINAEEESSALPIIPRYLKEGDTIGITSPAGYITADEIKPAVELIGSFGYKVMIGDTIGKRDFTFGGTDEERTKDFQQMLDNPAVKAILCARGGYGAVRIIDKLNWTKFKAKPKWIIGFSDITVFHVHLNRNFGIASVHSKMCNSFPEKWIDAEPIQKETILAMFYLLEGIHQEYNPIPNASNRVGIAEGVLVGGNLKILETLAGTSSDLKTDGKILFVEDTNEQLYSIDRMFWHLKRTGKLSKLKGLIVGGFKVKIEEGSDDFGKTVEQIVMEKIKGYNYPVCFDFPVGHQRNNYPIKHGAKHRLNVNWEFVGLREI
jgi:muramoyltetrapeptide carboxypeptidase